MKNLDQALTIYLKEDYYPKIVEDHDILIYLLYYFVKRLINQLINSLLGKYITSDILKINRNFINIL